MKKDLTPDETRDLPLPGEFPSPPLPGEVPSPPDNARAPAEEAGKPTSSARNWFLASVFFFLLCLVIFFSGSSGLVYTSPLGIFPLFASLWAAWMGINTLLKE